MTLLDNGFGLVVCKFYYRHKQQIKYKVMIGYHSFFFPRSFTLLSSIKFGLLSYVTISREIPGIF